MKNVIYKIRNLVNDKFYVGSTVDARVRFQAHRRKLRAGKHQSPHMQAAWDKYGEECFIFEVVEHVGTPELLLSAEQVWLDEHVGNPYCYNWATDASAPMRGKKHTKEALEKTALNRTPPRGENHYRYGKEVSDEIKKKIGDTQRGVKKPEGRRVSPEGIIKLKVAARRGKESFWYGKRPPIADISQKAIVAILPDRTIKEFKSLSYMRDTLGVTVPTIIRACASGQPIRQDNCAGWVLSYAEGEQHEAPKIPDEYMEYPRTRQLAKAVGAAQYYTGIPCERGHLSLRKTKGTCIACMKEDNKKDSARRRNNNPLHPN